MREAFSTFVVPVTAPATSTSMRFASRKCPDGYSVVSSGYSSGAEVVWCPGEKTETQSAPLGSHLLHGPGKARHDDHSLAVYEKAGFVGVEADQATAVVFMFVLGNAIGEAAAVSLRRRLRLEGSNADDLIRETMAQQIKVAQEFPRLRSRIATVTDADYSTAPARSFEFGLDVIFDGLERQLHEHKQPAPGSSANPVLLA